jgi:transcriptional regulator with XRE-family HTH domain
MSAATTLRAARRRARLSLRALAERAGTSHATLVAYESGAKIPRVDTLTRILRAAGFTVDFELTARPEGHDPAARGRELVAALELAAQFPSRHGRAIIAPPFRAVP